MNAYLDNYTYGNRMAIVSRSEDTCRELLSRGCEVMYICKDSVVFLPEELTYDGSRVKKDRLDKLCDYDIVEIGESGLLYRAFANNESDTTVFLGGACNSNCIMCPAGDAERRKGFSYSRDLLMKYIDYLPCDLEHIVITGGEPTLQSELFLEALERVRDKFPNTQVLLLTNGRSLSDKRFFEQTVSRRPARFRIAIPIHAATADLHDYITRAPGSFAQTMLGLDRLMASGIEVEIRIVVTKINCDCLSDIAELIISRFPRVFCINFVGLEPRGNCALNFDKVYIDHSSSFSKSKKAIDRLVACGYDVGLYNYPLCAIERDYWSIASKSISGYKNVYHPDCDFCRVKTICGGFFTAAMSIAKPKVFPVAAKEDLL